MTGPSPIRKKRGRVHGLLAERFLGDNADAPYRPEDWPDSPDYRENYVWLEADPDAEAENARITLAVVRGELDDQLDEMIELLTTNRPQAELRTLLHRLG